MKGLKTTLAILSLVFGGFAFIGIVQPSVEYGTIVNTGRDPITTWNVMVAEDLLSEWVEGHESIELIEGEMNAVGSKYEVTIVHEDQEYKMIETLKIVEPGKRLLMNLDNEYLSTDLEVLLESGPDGGTRVTTHNVAQGKSWFYRSIFPMMKGQFQEQEEKHYNAFAELVDRSDIDVFLNELQVGESDASEVPLDSTKTSN